MYKKTCPDRNEQDAAKQERDHSMAHVIISGMNIRMDKPGADIQLCQYQVGEIGLSGDVEHDCHNINSVKILDCIWTLKQNYLIF